MQSGRAELCRLSHGLLHGLLQGIDLLVLMVIRFVTEGDFLFLLLAERFAVGVVMPVVASITGVAD